MGHFRVWARKGGGSLASRPSEGGLPSKARSWGGTQKGPHLQAPPLSAWETWGRSRGRSRQKQPGGRNCTDTPGAAPASPRRCPRGHASFGPGLPHARTPGFSRSAPLPEALGTGDKVGPRRGRETARSRETLVQRLRSQQMPNSRESRRL